jgi:hypothetical protein
VSAQQDPEVQRSTLLPVMLGSMAAFFFLLVLVLLSGGFFLYLMLAVAGVTALGSLHWIVWGKLLTQLTAHEREEEELLDRIREQQDSGRFTTRR